MEEKERYYSLIDHNGNFELRDYECGKTIHTLFELDDLLNQYNKRVKELEEENQQLKHQLEEKDKEIENLSLWSERLYKLEARIGLEERTVGDVVEELDRLRNQLELSQIENMQLKQAQKQFTISILEDIMTHCRYGISDYWSLHCVCTIIENKIKKLKNSNSGD